MQKHVALQQRAPYKLDTIDESTELNHAKGMKMSNSPFEVPNELRDFAERSVEQARKAFEGFMSVAQKTAGVAGEATDSGQGGVKSVSAHVLSYTEQNVNAAFELANKLVRAKDPQEAFALQSEYMKTQLAALQAQAKELGAVFQKSMIPPGSN
jgi:phasin